MTVSVMRSCFPKHSPTLVKYRNYRNFMRENFRNELQYKLLALNDDAKFEDFETIFMNILNKHAPMKEKVHQSKQFTLHEQDNVQGHYD